MKLVAEVDPKDRELCEKINEKQERYMMINLLLLFGAPTICCVLIVLGTLGILPREVSYVSSFFLPVIYIVLGVRTALEDHFICKKFSIKHDDLIQYLFYRELILCDKNAVCELDGHYYLFSKKGNCLVPSDWIFEDYSREELERATCVVLKLREHENDTTYKVTAELR